MPGRNNVAAPHKDEPPGVQAEGFKGQEQDDSRDSQASGYGTQADAERMAVATMSAHAARAGCTLHELAGGGFLLCKWSLSRELPDLRAVAALLRRMGVQA